MGSHLCATCANIQPPTLDEERRFSCDPAGVVFEDTTRHISELDRLAFAFAGSSNFIALRWLFALGASPTINDANGTTLLHVACRKGSLNVLKDLLEHGLSPHAQDVAGWTPLHVAACIGHPDATVVLLEAGATAHCQNSTGETPRDLGNRLCMKQIFDKFEASAGGDGLPNEVMPLSGAIAEVQPDAPIFEPYFVPRVSIWHERFDGDDLTQQAIRIFNQAPGQGLAFVVATGLAKDSPSDLLTFLTSNGADPTACSDLLGEEYLIAKTLRLTFFETIPLLGTGVAAALEAAFSDIAVPMDFRKIDRFSSEIAANWWRWHEDEDNNQILPERQDKARPEEVSGFELRHILKSVEGLQRFFFSILVLHQKHVMLSLMEWIELNRGIEADGSDVPERVQAAVYQYVTSGSSRFRRCQALQTCQPKPALLEAAARINCIMQTHMGPTLDGSVLPLESPRILVAQGGAASAGCAVPTPRLLLVDEGLSTEAVTPVDAVRFNSRVAPRPTQATSRWEPVWVSLLSSLLFLSIDSDSATYAFVCLRGTTMRFSENTLQFKADHDSRLELCLLLADGRFQMLALPQLEVNITPPELMLRWVKQIHHMYGDTVTLGI
eukprot:NODE_3142_length_2085_cov_6.232380.p1 GENE.NODE_3142_length_2085_cov_6.232380~~NODE_3142_length_2085_cov_6.232380.p1  ORF type:complete len:610 (-),score=163.92 NODE_3142_length_2085_cov_6.232380:169-1998(-)